VPGLLHRGPNGPVQGDRRKLAIWTMDLHSAHAPPRSRVVPNPSWGEERLGSVNANLAPSNRVTVRFHLRDKRSLVL
jgi:hypothetical protein